MRGQRKTRYTPSVIPQRSIDLARFLQLELERVTDGIESPFTFQVLEALTAEPTRKRNGQTVFADGTNWNPGSGAGVYAYYGGSWKKLG